MGVGNRLAEEHVFGRRRKIPKRERAAAAAAAKRGRGWRCFGRVGGDYSDVAPLFPHRVVAGGRCGSGGSSGGERAAAAMLLCGV